jgi:DNA-binding CsgD family transcriptional regulator
MLEATIAPDMPITMRALSRMLDVVDYGMLVITGGARLVYINQVARAELDDDHPFQLVGRDLRVRHMDDLAAWQNALSRTLRRGVQSLLTIGAAHGLGISVSLIPMAEPAVEPAALIIFGRRRVCEDLSIEAYARQHDLTTAEARVLKLLSAGYRPNDIALVLGVRLSTVRTQIGSIRAKTCSRDIGQVLHRVARLPPLPCLLRSAA